ncbi:putative cysteine--tRNA ligase, mitochondrial isoform X2 [Halichoerus grypus]|uniref:probable cysteine--tRNA ligase, mitochondrial isoform X2 n=1 Tax=Halichoerus grypus TaxID=9711 RepID=UPI001659D330|nr:probable cysteine--tRNA ligase, mitochondrial isoform X2 [Halichoerus grypus]
MLRKRGAAVGPRLLRAALGLGARLGPARAASGVRGQGWVQPAGHDTGVKVYNSLTRRKDPLIVGSADAASWYSCGPTVYDHAHLGHACSYVRFDIIRRILTRVFGCNIIMVMGITDVDDKIIHRAAEATSTLTCSREETSTASWSAWSPVPSESQLIPTSGTPATLPCGRQPNPRRCFGTLLGEREDLAGTSNVPPSQVWCLEASWTSTRAGSIWPFRITRMKSPSVRLSINAGSGEIIFCILDFLKMFSPDVFRLFCMRSSYRSAIDYSDGTMLEAKHLLLAAAAFVEDARAYMKGQLACGPIRDDVLWERLRHAKQAVKAALADDFDTPAAVDAVMDLIHHGNRQLTAPAEEPGGPRSPAVFGSLVSYVEQFFETVGISLADRQCVSGDGSRAALHSVVEQLVQFRLRVRQFALASGAATREGRRQQLLDTQPLLEACDALRRDLVAHGISIKDRSSTSTWELLEQRTEGPRPGS